MLILDYYWSRHYDNNVNPDNHHDGSDGYDGSRDSASDTNDNSSIVVSATNPQEISPNSVEEGQGII
ncbi:MAG TPA: hypothetical protein VH500_03585 [Nitrososphaeraceae archaeon]|jgi:hypothetical protein